MIIQCHRRNSPYLKRLSGKEGVRVIVMDLRTVRQALAPADRHGTGPRPKLLSGRERALRCCGDRWSSGAVCNKLMTYWVIYVLTSVAIKAMIPEVALRRKLRQIELLITVRTGYNALINLGDRVEKCRQRKDDH